MWYVNRELYLRMEEGESKTPVSEQLPLGPPGTQQWSVDEYMDGKHLLKSTIDYANSKRMAIENHETNKQLLPLIAMNDSDEEAEDENAEVVLPQVLEDVLALKNQRALELGIDDISGNVDHPVTSKTQLNESEWDKEENVTLFYVYVRVHLIKDTFLQINVIGRKVEGEKNKDNAARVKNKRKKKKKKKCRKVEEQKNTSNTEMETTPEVEIE